MLGGVLDNEEPNIRMSREVCLKMRHEKVGKQRAIGEGVVLGLLGQWLGGKLLHRIGDKIPKYESTLVSLLH